MRKKPKQDPVLKAAQAQGPVEARHPQRAKIFQVQAKRKAALQKALRPVQGLPQKMRARTAPEIFPEKLQAEIRIPDQKII